MLEEDEIIDLIENYGECEYLDFKLSEYDTNSYNELLKDIIAFANAHNTNDKYIIVGIKKLPDGNIQYNDIDSITDDAIYQDFITQYVEKSIIFNYLPFKYKEHKLGIIKISKDNYNNRPFLLKKDYVKNGKIIFRTGEGRIRHGSSTSPLNSRDYEKIFNNSKSKNKLTIKTLHKDSICENITYENFDSDYIKEQDNLNNEICKLIDEINTTKLDDISPSVSKAITSPYSLSLLSGKEIENVSVDNETMKQIQLFCNKYSYKLNDDFFNLGNLKKCEKMVFSNSFPHTEEYFKGTPVEQTKYSNIIKLHELILKYVFSKSYIENITGLNFFRFILSNEGLIPDEDIEVSLILPKGLIETHHKFLNKNMYTAVFSRNMFYKWFEMRRQSNIDTYSDIEFDFTIDDTYYDPIFHKQYYKNSEDKLEELKNTINDYLEDSIFDFDIISSGEFDIIRYSQNKLMHNTNCFFPSVVVLNSVPQEINYEIKSKNMENILKGKITL